MPVRGHFVPRFDGPVGWGPLVGLLGLLHVQGALMSAPYTPPPRRVPYWPELVRAVAIAAMVCAFMFAALVAAALMGA